MARRKRVWGYDLGLESVEAADRRVDRFILLAAVVEIGLWATFLAVMDFGARLHWLVLIAAVLVYTTIGVGLLALAAYTRLNAIILWKDLSGRVNHKPGE